MLKMYIYVGAVTEMPCNACYKKRVVKAEWMV